MKTEVKQKALQEEKKGTRPTKTAAQKGKLVAVYRGGNKTVSGLAPKRKKRKEPIK